MKRKIFFVALLCTFSLSACGGGNTSTTETPTESSVEETVAEESTAEDSSVSADNDSDGWGSVRALGLDNSTMLSIIKTIRPLGNLHQKIRLRKGIMKHRLMKRLQKNMVFQQMMLLTYICMYWETTIK